MHCSINQDSTGSSFNQSHVSHEFRISRAVVAAILFTLAVTFVVDNFYKPEATNKFLQELEREEREKKARMERRDKSS